MDGMMDTEVEAAAVHAAPAIPVAVSRETLVGDMVVNMKVPMGAVDDTFIDPEGVTVPLLRFGQNVRGGWVNFFVHTADHDRIRGRFITARAALMEKVLSDGRRYMYIDLFPVEDDVTRSHRISVLTATNMVAAEGEFLRFDTPAPLSGTIYVLPAEAKLVDPQMPKGTDPLSKQKAKPTSNDTQLDRLLTQGWQIESEATDFVKLFKGEGEGRKSLTHFRPKDKKAKKK